MRSLCDPNGVRWALEPMSLDSRSRCQSVLAGDRIRWSAKRALARQRARPASATLHRLANGILKECRAAPAKDARLVRTLIAATDAFTQKRLSDKDIVDELIVFLFAGHDTTATTLTYATWQLGRHLEIQHRVATESLGSPKRH